MSNKKISASGIDTVAWVALGALIILGIWQYSVGDDLKLSPPPSAQKTDNDAEPGFVDLVQEKKFLAANTGYLHAMELLIKNKGYACPKLAMLEVKGQSPYGSKLDALCGPNDNSGNSYPSMHYAVYPDKLKVNLCGEFSATSGDCS